MLGTIQDTCSESKQIHTGRGQCSTGEGKTIALLITKTNAAFPLDPEEFKSKLESYVNSEGPLKIWPITNITENTPNGGDIATTAVGFAGDRAVGYNGFSEVYRVDAGDCFFKQISQFNRQPAYVFRIDDTLSLQGVVRVQNGKEVLTGFEASTLMAQRTKGTSMTDIYQVALSVNYSVNYGSVELPNLHSFKLDQIPTGLIGVMLKKNGSGVKVVSSCDGYDYTRNYEWTADLFANASGAVPTSVTFNESTGLLTISPAGSYRILGASVLSEHDIYGLDGIKEFVDIS